MTVVVVLPAASGTSIVDYASLQAAVADWANRSDLTERIADFISLAEARMYDMLILKDMETDSPLTLTTGQNYVALPSGYISPIAFWLIVDSQRVPLLPVLPQELPYDTGNNQPRLWAIDGANIRFDCPASEDYSAFLRCLKKSHLSGSVTTNYLLARRPDIYLAASLVEVARYTRDQELFSAWEPKFIKASAEFKAAENRARGMVPMRTDIPVRGRSNILTGD
jgi:hypothetical protein